MLAWEGNSKMDQSVFWVNVLKVIQAICVLIVKMDTSRPFGSSVMNAHLLSQLQFNSFAWSCGKHSLSIHSQVTVNQLPGKMINRNKIYSFHLR